MTGPFRVNLKKLNISFISSITLYLIIMVSQHCKYKFKCTLVMIIIISVIESFLACGWTIAYHVIK